MQKKLSGGKIMNKQKNDINEELERGFTDVLAEKLPKALPTIVDASFEPVIYPAGFNYGLTYGANAYYNPASLSTLNSTLRSERRRRYQRPKTFGSVYISFAKFSVRFLERYAETA